MKNVIRPKNNISFYFILQANRMKYIPSQFKKQNIDKTVNILNHKGQLEKALNEIEIIIL